MPSRRVACSLSALWPDRWESPNVVSRPVDPQSLDGMLSRAQSVPAAATTLMTALMVAVRAATVATGSVCCLNQLETLFMIA